MGKGLVALSSAAIVSVYGIGYAVTQPAAVSMAAGVAPSASAASAPMVSPAAGAAASPSQSSPASTTATASALKDGTYTGTGWSRHGSVSVSVTVQGGRIASAPITGVTTRYSQSVIAGLPAKVLAAQSSRVDLVSGATDSSGAYQSAVSQALAQAGGPATTSATGAPSAGNVQVTGPGGSTIYRNGGGRRNRGGGANFGY
ncbi:MAG: FMN-binding protein [Chloroflexota bacterium]